MTREKTIARIRKVVHRSLRDRPDAATAEELPIGENTAIDSLGFDSLTILDLIYDLQQEFQCEGDIRDMAGLRTVNDLALYLENKEAE